jgi:radical SAM protein with 4Fe4S-binding SPASM domain
MEIEHILDKEKGPIKFLKSENYNYLFRLNDGYFTRWGRTLKDDPDYSPFGPEIMDIEISTICSRACSWCYKSNTREGTYMSFDTFQKMFSKFPKTLTQIAFGIGDIDGNPDMWKIFDHCRNNGVVPNVTINGERLTEGRAESLAKVCGAVAVSHYNKEMCYNAVKKLTDAGLKQVNIHKLFCQETYESCFELIRDMETDPRLAKMKAVVFLWLKPKGDRNVFHRIGSLEEYKRLVNFALEHNARIGFDSCSAPMFAEAIKDHPQYSIFLTMVESCESTLFSYYINTDGMGFPCSFCEGQPEFKGINILETENFLKEVWYGEEAQMFRKNIIESKDCAGCRRCWVFDLTIK